MARKKQSNKKIQFRYAFALIDFWPPNSKLKDKKKITITNGKIRNTAITIRKTAIMIKKNNKSVATYKTAVTQKANA